MIGKSLFRTLQPAYKSGEFDLSVLSMNDFIAHFDL